MIIAAFDDLQGDGAGEDKRHPLVSAKKITRNIIYLCRLVEEFGPLMTWTDDLLCLWQRAITGTLETCLISPLTMSLDRQWTEAELKRFQSFHRNLQSFYRKCLASIFKPSSSSSSSASASASTSTSSAHDNALQVIFDLREKDQQIHGILSLIQVIQICMEMAESDSVFKATFYRYWWSSSSSFENLLNLLDEKVPVPLALIPNDIYKASSSTILALSSHPAVPVMGVMTTLMARTYSMAESGEFRQRLDEIFLPLWNRGCREARISSWLFIDLFHFLRNTMSRGRFKLQISVTLSGLQKYQYNGMVSLGLEKLLYSLSDSHKDAARRFYVSRYSDLTARKSCLVLWNEASHWPWHHFHDASLNVSLERLVQVLMAYFSSVPDARLPTNGGWVELAVYLQWMWRMFAEGAKISGWKAEKIKKDLAESLINRIIPALKINNDGQQHVVNDGLLTLYSFHCLISLE